MEGDLTDVAARYQGSVRLERLNVDADPEAARRLDVRVTPTLIGYVDDIEVYRATGRQARSDLDAAFAALAAHEAPSGAVPRTDVALRVGAGAVLVVAGVVTGGTWPLILIGGTVAGSALVPVVRRRRAHRSQ